MPWAGVKCIHQQLSHYCLFLVFTKNGEAVLLSFPTVFINTRASRRIVLPLPHTCTTVFLNTLVVSGTAGALGWR